MTQLELYFQRLTEWLDSRKNLSVEDEDKLLTSLDILWDEIPKEQLDIWIGPEK
jgi:hypothetical protein